MMKSNHKLNAVPLKGLFLVGMLLFASCQDDEEFARGETSLFSDIVTFGMKTLDGWKNSPETRGAETESTPTSHSKSVEVGETPSGEKLLLRVTVSEGIEEEAPKDTAAVEGESRASTSLPTDDKLDFGIFSYLMDKNGDTPPAYDAVNSTLFMNHNRVDVDQNYAYSPIKYWPGDAYWLKFFAYRPHVNVVNGTTDEEKQKEEYVPKDTDYLKVEEKEGMPELTYTVPENVDKQVDLLATSTDMIKGDSRQTVNLPFKHLLSAVKFKVGNIPDAFVTEIGLDRIKNQGTYTMDDAEGMEVTSSAATKNFHQILTSHENYNNLTTPVAKGEQIGETFYMVPQELKDTEARIYMQLLFKQGTGVGGDRNKTYTLDRKLSDLTDDWKGNTTYTYSLNTPEEISIDVKDKVLGNVKQDLVIRNTGLATVYIRATIVGNWVVKEKINESDEKETVYVVADWKKEDGYFTSSSYSNDFYWADGTAGSGVRGTWYKSGGYYYFMMPVPKEAPALPKLFDTYTLTANPPVPGAYLELTIAVQAVMKENVIRAWPAIADKLPQ